jgi:DNA excision repair protein ERCC-2
VSTKFDERENPGVIRNFGNLLEKLSGIVPDGMVCYFTSYKYMEHVIVKWNEMNILQRVLENKLIFIETKDSYETVLALQNYRKACDNGRGAVFFATARGKISEGVNFSNHYARCVLMFGIPFHN